MKMRRVTTRRVAKVADYHQAYSVLIPAIMTKQFHHNCIESGFTGLAVSLNASNLDQCKYINVC